MSAANPFLTAEWRQVAIVNYAVDRDLLTPFVPKGTVLDTYRGVAYVSLVGLLFKHTKVWGVSVPFHSDFEEINLRIYVRRFADDDWRRGVVFIKEIVPRFVVAKLARLLYDENYEALPTRHHIRVGVIEYQWQFNGRWQTMHLETKDDPTLPDTGSLEEFIVEHYWGYTIRGDGGAYEYQVQHEPWKVWTARNVLVDLDAQALYGEPFGAALMGTPVSAFVAEGSPVRVFKPAVLV